MSTTGDRDGGFTLLEMLVALALMGTLMAALVPFFISSLRVTDADRDRQVAINLASDAMERARSLNGAGLVEGRSEAAVQAQWAQAPAAVRDTYATQMLCAWDPKLSPDPAQACNSSAPAAGAAAGAQAPLPTDPVGATVTGVTYQQHWYVGQCWQSADTDAGCTATTGTDLYMRVVVAVTWSHRSCPGGACVYLTTTLVSPVADPVFNIWAGGS
jgi:prepilin-type N-terminal cleavage/methylation domain-containing protein